MHNDDTLHRQLAELYQELGKFRDVVKAAKRAPDDKPTDEEIKEIFVVVATIVPAVFELGVAYDRLAKRRL